MRALGILSEFITKQRLAAHAEEVLRGLGIKPGDTVVDFGCGSGTYAFPAARIVGSQGKVYAVDINSGSLRKLAHQAAREGLVNVVTVPTRREVRLPLSDGCCDVFLLFDVLQEIEDWDALLGEACRLLREGGTLSVFPMHVPTARVTQMAQSCGLANAPSAHPLLNFREQSSRKP